jgi:glycosyltransferase involved in cell wall biosynthesis
VLAAAARVIVAHVHRMRGIGGSERHLLTLLPALRSLGIDARFVGLDDLDGWNPQPFYDALGDVPFVRLRSVRGLRRALHSADVVHTHLVHADVFGALAAGQTRLFSTKHNDDRFRTGPWRYAERLLARRAEKVVAITQALKRFQVERVGLPPEKVDVIPYGLDAPPAPWGTNPGLDVGSGRIVASVARLEPQKGVDVAVRALAGLDATLIVLGEGPERPRLEALARELGARLVLPGRVPDVAAVLRQAHVLVHPARWEGFGLAVLEAMLCSLPVVATNVSSLPELVVDGETGYLVPPDDPDALRGALQRVLENPGDLGARGHERARREFSVERMATRTARLYGRAESGPPFREAR